MVFFPEIYPGELIYSVLSRIKIHCGYVSNRRFVSDMLANPKERANVLFMNKLKDDVMEVFLREWAIDELIEKHTLLPHLVRFQNSEEKRRIRKLVEEGENKVRMLKLVHFREERNMKYCPLCVAFDRKKYGETYWHREHQTADVSCCSAHGIKLQNSSFVLGGNSGIKFWAAEEVLTEEKMVIEKVGELEKKYAEYNKQLLKLPVGQKDGRTVICDYLSGSKYMCSIGKSYKLPILYEDLLEFYKEFPKENRMISKYEQIRSIVYGRNNNTRVIAQVAFFLGIPPNAFA